MPQLPVPQRGQPLEVSYIADIVNQINSLTTELGSSNNSVSVKISPTDPANSSKITRSAIDCQTKDLTTKTLTAGQGESIEVLFSFSSPPMVTATVWNKGGTPAGQDVSVQITNITTSKASLYAKFGSNGDATVSINVVAIGQP